MFSSFGRRALAINCSVVAVGAIEIYGYYWLFPKVIRSNFDNTQLPEKANYSEPVLVIHEDEKFVFKHRGGKEASISIVNDTFTNSKLLKRAVTCQVLTSISITIGYAKSRAYMLPVCMLGIMTNISLIYPIFHSAVNLLQLSRLVANGDVNVWENLNEARYAQKLMEYFNPIDIYTKNFGMFGSLFVMIYCSPFLGLSVAFAGKIFSIHKRLQ